MRARRVSSPFVWVSGASLPCGLKGVGDCPRPRATSAISSSAWLCSAMSAAERLACAFLGAESVCLCRLHQPCVLKAPRSQSLLLLQKQGRVERNCSLEAVSGP
ncbi:hypothetical protein NDU88_003548 [Pleurodeles waltl]|uniref:Secreted protein n=1 Tax=Pleurodeles waltl TaxID=8319 RepID=A0AAV7LG47_PLEWA|nr:hypothetical protein NDU88_003548 [Pleurodeles waltl]